MSAMDSPTEPNPYDSPSHKTDLSVSRAMLQREIRGIELEMDILRNPRNPDPTKAERLRDLQRERQNLVDELDRVRPPGIAPGEGWEAWV